ncbi:MAG: cytochrome c [Chthoniobacter sp.]|nr:cytochrome c [Chthoniobacter sp.]
MRFRVLLFCASATIAVAVEAPPEVQPRELPRFAPVAPEQALDTFQIRRGFHLELVAAEPLVVDPIAVCFDEDGRLFAIEMRDYSEQRDVQPHLGQVRLLEDLDGDGRCEKATVFADNLPWPTALIWANGGLFVCAAPDIFFLQDTDGDGRADKREIVFTGFNTGAPKVNVQALPNSFAWGPDNRIHLQTGGGNRGMIRCLRTPDSPAQELGGRDFWFDPRTFAFGFEAGGGQYGMSYDDHGRRFVCNNSDHLRTFVFDSRYAARNPHFAMPSPLVSVAADGGAAEVFRISPDEPWRVVRTRWRTTGKVPGIVEGGGRVSGYFTGATGTTVYRGDAFGAQYVGDTFTGDAGGNLVHHKRLRPDGVSVIGERPPDEKTSEFVASRDTWFRPVSFANAPDGSLYICDMYREVIEHPWSIPEQIKQHLDLTSGSDRGRIWRIARDGFESRPAPRLSRATTTELIATLNHPNGWHRDTATRLLCERRDAAAVLELEESLVTSTAPLGRLHTLRTLAGLEALSVGTLVLALDDAHEAVREHAVLLCEQMLRDGRMPTALWTKLCSMAEFERAPRVRLQLAFTFGECRQLGQVEALASMTRGQDVGDGWIRAAIVSAPPALAGPLWSSFTREPGFSRSAWANVSPGGEAERVGGHQLLLDLASVIGASAPPERIDEVAKWALTASYGPWNNPHVGVLTALGPGLRALKPATATMLEEAFAKARVEVRNAGAAPQTRAREARLLGFDPSELSRDALISALDPECPEALATTIFAALASFSKVEPVLLQRWPELSEPVRAAAVRFLSGSPVRALALLRAAEAGAVAAADIPPTEAVRLRESKNREVATLAAKLLPKPAVEHRDDKLRRFAPATELAGDAGKGRVLFQQRCATCHKFRGEGHAFGPDLESIVAGGKAKLLTHIVDPDREVAPQFAAYLAELTDGVTMSGIVISETPESVRFVEPAGREQTIPRARILRLQTTGRSPMPEGLDAGLDEQGMADLLHFLAPNSRRTRDDDP